MNGSRRTSLFAEKMNDHHNQFLTQLMGENMFGMSKVAAVIWIILSLSITNCTDISNTLSYMKMVPYSLKDQNYLLQAFQSA